MDQEEFKQELKQMILTADASIHDVSQYALTYNDLYVAWYDLIWKECYVEYQAYKLVSIKSTKSSNNTILTIRLTNIDDEYFTRLKNMKGTINEILSGIDPKMSELEKVLYVHEYLVDYTIYKQDAEICFKAGGPLAKGYGVCEGFTQAMRVILKKINIECSYIVSNSMNHKWVYVKLDGNWYHIDPTWDRTKSSTPGRIFHHFFLRNDTEFLEDTKIKHRDWYNPSGVAADSDQYTNWFVHDVIGTMHYCDGFWYFTDVNLNQIIRCKIDGSFRQVIINDEGTDIPLLIRSVNSLKLSYYRGNVCHTLYQSDIPSIQEPAIITDPAEGNDQNSNYIENMNLQDFSLWKSGFYTEEGTYKASSARICLTDMAYCDPNRVYTISFNSNNTIIVIRYLDEEQKVIQSKQYKKSGSFTTTDDTRYLKIFMYLASPPPITYSTFEDIFNNNYEIKIS